MEFNSQVVGGGARWAGSAGLTPLHFDLVPLSPPVGADPKHTFLLVAELGTAAGPELRRLAPPVAASGAVQMLTGNKYRAPS